MLQQRHQLIENLPKTRVRQGRPFNTSGIDHAGPIQIHMSKGRENHGYQGYIVLFICFMTHAIHLKVVCDLTLAKFLSAYRRLVGRREIYSQLYSNNGTTFQEATSEIREMFNASFQLYSQIANTLVNDESRWHFILSNSPYCGGLWKAGVKIRFEVLSYFYNPKFQSLQILGTYFMIYISIFIKVILILFQLISNIYNNG